MTPVLFVVSDPVLRDQLNLVRTFLRAPVSVVDLATHRRGIWDFRKLAEFRKTLSAHRNGAIHALGRRAAQAVALAGLGVRFRRLRVSGEVAGPSYRVLNREFAAVAWPWAIPAAPSPLNREEILARHGVPPTAFVYATASRFRDKSEAWPPMWGFEILRYSQPEVYLLIHGDGPKLPEAVEFSRGMAPEGTRVRCVGPDLPMTGLFGISDVVMAMSEESLMAALAARKPIVAPRKFSELLKKDEEALLADPTDPPGLARAMMKLLADKRLRTSLAGGADALRERYSPANAARALEANALAAESPP